MNVTLYTTHCPKCKVLEKKLNVKKITYEEVEDLDIISKKGISLLPVLEVDGTMMEFGKANDWINSQEA